MCRLVGVEAEAFAVVARGLRRDDEPAVAKLQRAMVLELVGERDSRPAREVVVTRAGLAHRLTRVDRLQADRPRGVAGDVRQRLERLGDVRAGEPGLPPAPDARGRDQAGGFELAQVAGDRRRRDADPRGERTGRQRRPAEQLLEHPRAGPVGERGGDVGEVGHVSQATPATFRPAPKRRAHNVRVHAARRPRPDPGPPGPYGTMAWLRATVSRFANGATHTRRRALVEALLADLDPAELREAAADLRHESKLDRALPDEPFSRRADAPYIPVAVLAQALGVDPPHLADAVAATRLVAAAYHPHTGAPGADAALATLLTLLPAGEPEVVAAQVQILVQACEATAGLVRGDDLPVPVTRRIGPNGETVLVDLTGRPFGAGSRRCPGEAHARALVEGVLGR